MMMAPGAANAVGHHTSTTKYSGLNAISKNAFGQMGHSVQISNK
jgi:hypothetical protein